MGRSPLAAADPSEPRGPTVFQDALAILPSVRILIHMRLIVAEKPSVGRDIASALESLPILPERFKVRVNYKTREQFAVVKGLMRDPSVEEVVNACDAGREGELIFAYLYGLSGCKKPVLRLWISSLTPEAIREGFDSLRAGRSMKPLEDAARCRGEADWIVGMNATRAYSVRFGGRGNVLSVGRVQTPTLKLLVDREKEIQDFEPEKFWTVHARFAREAHTYDGVWFKNKNNRLSEREAAERIAQKASGGTGTVRKAQKKTVTEKPPLLYDLTELQRNANARYGFTAERTLRVAQALYEERKFITCPRTSSRYLSRDMVAGLKKRVEAAGALPELSSFAEMLLGKEKLPISKRVVDDSKVTDHHAIVPTNKESPGGLPADETKVYDLVARRFLAVFFPAARFENTTVVTEVRKETFLSRGRVVLEAGWRALYPDGVGGRKEKESPVLPPIEVGQEWDVAKVGVKEGETKPPPRYSESALLGAMETAGKLVEDEELRQQMKDSGLGTPATRAATIERLIKVGYIEREKKALVPTEKGRSLIGLLGESPLSSPELTARWEERLAKMEKGTEHRPDFMADISGFTTKLVEEVRRMEGEKLASPARSREPLGVCPKCGSPVVETKKAYSCSAWKKTGCDFAIWKQVSGKRLSVSQAKQLLTGGRTAPLKGFRSKAGKPYAAALKLDGEHKVRLDFDNSRKESSQRHSDN